jgi:hypothetical protein
MNNSPATVLQEWIPYKLIYQGDIPCCEWLYLDQQPFNDPFFEDTIFNCRTRPVNLRRVKMVSSLDILPEWSAAIDHVQPTAFIFHVSRCGSTLLSQLLSLDQRHIVLSEVSFFDQLLCMPFSRPDLHSVSGEEFLKWAIPFYGRKRNGEEQHLFIKTDCWHIFFYDRLRALYPDVPFILLYRSPDEVLRSQQKQRGMQSVPGLIPPSVMGMTLEEGNPALTDLDLYFCQVLEKILEAFANVYQKDKNTLLVNYNEGMINIVQKMMDFSGLPPGKELLQQMQERSKYHGKYGDQPFATEPPGVSSGYLDGCWHWYNRLQELITSSKELA